MCDFYEYIWRGYIGGAARRTPGRLPAVARSNVRRTRRREGLYLRLINRGSEAEEAMYTGNFMSLSWS